MVIVRFAFDPNDIVKRPFEKIMSENEFISLMGSYKQTTKDW
jgi:hypothetical protein